MNEEEGRKEDQPGAAIQMFDKIFFLLTVSKKTASDWLVRQFTFIHCVYWPLPMCCKIRFLGSPVPKLSLQCWFSEFNSHRTFLCFDLPPQSQKNCFLIYKAYYAINTCRRFVALPWCPKHILILFKRRSVGN